MKKYLTQYVSSIKKFSDFEGKADLREFAVFLAVHVAIIAMLSGFMFFFENDFVVKVLTTFRNLYLVGTILPCLSLVVRRLHHLGRSGKMAFTALVPVVGILYLLFICLRNRGDDSGDLSGYRETQTSTQ